MTLSEKFVGKYMRLARQIGLDQNPCHSRKIGVVIVDPIHNSISGTGYNGPAPGTPHCDSEVYLREFFWPQLTFQEKDSIRLEVGGSILDLDYDPTNYMCDHVFDQCTQKCTECEITQKEILRFDNDVKYNKTVDRFVEKYAGCKQCPRRLVGAPSGMRTELCSCGHAERHAITNAARQLSGHVMFCWCGVPCLQCTDAIIQAMIKTVHVLKWNTDYSKMSRWLFAKANVEIIEHNEGDLLNV